MSSAVNGNNVITGTRGEVKVASLHFQDFAVPRKKTTIFWVIN